MRNTTFFCFFAFCLFLLTACDALPLPGVVTVAPETQTAPAETLTPLQPVSPLATSTLIPSLVPATPSPEPSATLAPTPAAPLPVRYVLNVQLDYAAKTLAAQEQIDYPNASGETLNELVLAVEPNRIPGVFSLTSLTVDGAPAENTLTGHKLTIKLATPLASGQTVKMELGFSLNLPSIEQGDPNVIRPQIFGVSTRQVNLTDWYPMLVPYQPGSGWVLHDPWFYGEHLVYPLANFDVTLRFADPANAPVVAASAPAETITDGAHYVLENARDFVLALGQTFKSSSAEVNGITVTSYYYPGNEVPGQAALKATVQALATYSELFGPYPHPSLAVIQGDFNDGMEFDGLYYLSNAFYNLYDNTEKNYLVMVAVHETCHQWWFGRVANDQNREPWLDESLATYCEKLFYEKNYPKSLGWWWDYRINFYQPEGKIDGNVPSYGGFTPYTNATYRLGARFLEELRTQMGDEAFFAFLKDYARQMDGKIATAEDFFRILSLHTATDLSTFLGKYFQNSH